jgi:hypothetical protein
VGLGRKSRSLSLAAAGDFKGLDASVSKRFRSYDSIARSSIWSAGSTKPTTITPQPPHLKR